MDLEFLKGRKILIVDDDFSSRLYLNKILEKSEAELLNAVNGQEAVDITLDNQDVDIVLMDIQLPVLDGYLAANRIREIREDIVIIAQTAFGLLGDKEKIIASGFDDYIIKPILMKVLIEKLKANLNISTKK